MDSAVASARRPLFVTIDFSKLWEDVPDSINESLLFFPVASEQRPRRIEQLGLGAVPPCVCIRERSSIAVFAFLTRNKSA